MTGTAVAPATSIRPRTSSALHDIVVVAGRALRAIPHEPEAVIPALAVPVFFFIVNVGALQNAAEKSGAVSDFKAFQLPVAIIFAVTGVSRAVGARDRHPGRLLRPAVAHAGAATRVVARADGG